MKKTSKRILAGVLAGTMVASFAGCTNQYKKNLVNISAQEQSFMDEYGYNDRTYDELSEYMVVRYKSINLDEERITILYPWYDPLCDNISIYTIEKECLSEFELTKDEIVQYNSGSAKQINTDKIKIVANELGKAVSLERLSKYLVDIYGIKSEYSAQEIYGVLEKLSYFETNSLYVDEELVTNNKAKTIIK